MDNENPPPISEQNAPPPPPPAVPSPADTQADPTTRNARHNCIVMFILFCLAIAATLASLMQRGTAPAVAGLGVLGTFAAAGGVFAAIYVPLRWQTLRSVRPPLGILGIIGGIGLIAYLAMILMGLAVTALS